MNACTTELTYSDTTSVITSGLPGFQMGTFTGGVTPALDNFTGGSMASDLAALDVEQVWLQPQHFPSSSVESYQDYKTQGSAPTNPALGYCRNYFDTTTGLMKAINSSGASCAPGGISGMTAGQVPIAASAGTITSSKALQGTDASILSAGTVSGTAAALCTDANGGATTVGCSGGAISGMTTGQVAIAGSASSITSSKALQGTDTNILTSSIIAAGAGNVLCTDTGSGATTSGCPTATVMVYNTASIPSTTNVSPTTMVASTSALHSYTLSWNISLTASGTGCGSSTTVNLNVIFTDPNTSTPFTELLGTITIAAGGNGTVGFVAQGVDAVVAKAATAVQYSTTGYTAGTGCTVNPTYQVSPTLVQLW